MIFNSEFDIKIKGILGFGNIVPSAYVRVLAKRKTGRGAAHNKQPANPGSSNVCYMECSAV